MARRQSMLTDANIVLLDRTKQSKLLLARVANALTMQAQLQFGLAAPAGWGVGARVRVGNGASDLRPGEWPLYLLPNSAIDEADALGYHDETDDGMPVLKVFPELDADDGTPWSVTASHEMLEALADPYLGRCVQDDSGRVWSLEVCDAVEADHYEVGGIEVSNFVLPAWYEPPRKASKQVQFDWLGRCVKAFEVRDGGYAQYLSGHEWTTVEPKGRRAARERLRNAGRSAKRRKRCTPEHHCLEDAYEKQLRDIGEMLVRAGILTEEAIKRQGVRFAVRDRFEPPQSIPEPVKSTKPRKSR